MRKRKEDFKEGISGEDYLDLVIGLEYSSENSKTWTKTFKRKIKKQRSNEGTNFKIKMHLRIKGRFLRPSMWLSERFQYGEDQITHQGNRQYTNQDLLITHDWEIVNANEKLYNFFIFLLYVLRWANQIPSKLGSYRNQGQIKWHVSIHCV